ncbi:hypothetical protein, partial [Mesorhizobium sp. M4B.F.Ca.ET.013.02.1.1]|uniref:hypothetical protein n=1 Tax=Mesorhizobium sp. M4B.F.Ca.ET.013.02.1.1 TaxID=2496755 RepID=UPI000FD57A65
MKPFPLLLAASVGLFGILAAQQSLAGEFSDHGGPATATLPDEVDEGTTASHEGDKGDHKGDHKGEGAGAGSHEGDQGDGDHDGDHESGDHEGDGHDGGGDGGSGGDGGGRGG